MTLAAVAYYLASRLAYVLYIGVALRRQEREARYTYEGFRRVASLLMLNDGLALVALCVVTRDTMVLPFGASRAVVIVAGAALVGIGVAVKGWAAATLGADAYYWRDFFAPPRKPEVVVAGPYRFLANPMYTVGYLQTYGVALITASLPGLAAAAFAQAAILVFYHVVEKPHFRRLRAGPERAV